MTANEMTPAELKATLADLDREIYRARHHIAENKAQREDLNQVAIELDSGLRTLLRWRSELSERLATIPPAGRPRTPSPEPPAEGDAGRPRRSPPEANDQ